MPKRIRASTFTVTWPAGRALVCLYLCVSGGEGWRETATAAISRLFPVSDFARFDSKLGCSFSD
jgi:hypothetical protein